MNMQTIVVVVIIGLSAFYLARLFLKSIKSKTKGHCSGCGKDN